jgi:hypothetical protein
MFSPPCLVGCYLKRAVDATFGVRMRTCLASLLRQQQLCVYCLSGTQGVTSLLFLQSPAGVARMLFEQAAAVSALISVMCVSHAACVFSVKSHVCLTLLPALASCLLHVLCCHAVVGRQCLFSWQQGREQGVVLACKSMNMRASCCSECSPACEVLEFVLSHTI